MRISPPRRLTLSAAVLAVCLAFLPFLFTACERPDDIAISAPTGAHEYLFCFWNVENFFDDKYDGRTGPGDKEMDGFFANHPDILKLKLDHLSDALLKMNGGKGPDILAICEVESVRAAQLLQKALNDRLSDPALHYQHVLMKEITAGRHIAPAILTRLPVVADRTRVHGSRLRILEGRIKVNEHELIVLASHWTSRLRSEGGAGRDKYANQLYGVTNAIYKSNPQADVLICGDFNDTPEDEAVVNRLHASGDRKAVVESKETLRLFNLMAGKDASSFGTHYYSGWAIFDQIVVSPGMLDGAGWAVEADSLQPIRTLTKPGDRIGRPWRFGGEKEKGPRGYSDHFPVTVKLRVQ
ncbi:MAG: hypothetical protein U0793_01755 [Gemmataceae bacterium]